MHQNGIVHGLVEVQQGLQHIVLYLDKLQSLVHTFLVLARHDGHNVPHIAEVTVDEQTVIRARLRIGLTGLCIATAVLRNVLPGINGFDAGHLHGHLGIDLLHPGMGMGRAQKLHDEAVLRRKILCIHRLSGDELHGIDFAYRSVHNLHQTASFFPAFSCFQARKALMPRS